jgi:transcription antitermination factor NusG
VRGLIELPRREPARLGDRVRVMAGPFAGTRGLYQGMRGNDRVEVLLALLGRVTLPVGSVEAVAPR